MIQPHELRKGNKIIANGLHGGRIMTVDRLADKGTLSEENRPVMFEEHEVGEFLKDCEVIPLSPEILQACGFEQLHPKSWNLYWESYELHYSEHDKELGILSPDGCTSGHTVYFPCGQLHLLQNIYFFFTGTELTINIEKVKV